jgi:hypothetical protein
MRLDDLTRGCGFGGGEGVGAVQMNHAAGLPFSYHGVVESVMCEPLTALDARVPQRGILVATEREQRLIHLLGIEYSELFRCPK